MVTVRSKYYLKNAIISGENKIRVDDPQLAKWIVRVYGINKIVWSMTIASIGVAVAVDIATGGTGSPASALFFAPVLFLVGISGASAMIGLGVALGGIAGLKTIRNEYEVISKGKSYVVIKRKRA